jgi:hypothetical protein
MVKNGRLLAQGDITQRGRKTRVVAEDFAQGSKHHRCSFHGGQVGLQFGTVSESGSDDDVPSPVGTQWSEQELAHFASTPSYLVDVVTTPGESS